MASKTRTDIRDFARTLLSEPTAKYWSDSELNDYINDGLEDFCVATDCLEDISTDSFVQYKADYNLPTDYTKLKQVEVVKGNSRYLIDPEDLIQSFNGIVKTTQSPPEAYKLWEGKISFRERPSSAATYSNIHGDFSATDTTITVDSTSGFPRCGRVAIFNEPGQPVTYATNECFEYWGISGNNLTGCVRGLEGSTATVVSDDLPAYVRDIWIYHYKKETLTSDSSTPTIPTQFHMAPAYYAASIGRRKSKDHDLAREYMAEYEKLKAQGLEWAKTKWRRHYTPK